MAVAKRQSSEQVSAEGPSSVQAGRLYARYFVLKGPRIRWIRQSPSGVARVCYIETHRNFISATLATGLGTALAKDDSVLHGWCCSHLAIGKGEKEYRMRVLSNKVRGKS